MINKNILIITILFSVILSISLVTSQDFTFKLNDAANFTLPCTLNGFPCSSSATCNLTIRFLNNSYKINNQLMNNLGNGDFTSEVNFSSLETLRYKGFCNEAGENGTLTGDIFITPTGRTFDEGQGTTAIGIMFGALAVSFLFLIMGFSLEKNPSTMALGFFFVIFSIILAIYSLHLGYVYSNDILQYESLVPVSSTIYSVILFSLGGLAVISGALMLIRFIVELGKMNKSKKFGEGFNPITGTYDF